MTWTDERVELLKRLWAEGLSASQIAAEIGGVTRNAVIGKVHRLGLSGREKPSTAPAVKARQKRRPLEMKPSRPAVAFSGNAALALRDIPFSEVFPEQEAEQDPEPAPAAEVTPFTCERVTILELREHMCRWPLGDPSRPEFRFCGARTGTGSPYCSHHAALAYQPTADRKRKLAAG